MTTLRDLLSDFAMDMIKASRDAKPEEVADLVDRKNELIDEYIKVIKERIIG